MHYIYATLACPPVSPSFSPVPTFLSVRSTPGESDHASSLPSPRSPRDHQIHHHHHHRERARSRHGAQRIAGRTQTAERTTSERVCTPVGGRARVREERTKSGPEVEGLLERAVSEEQRKEGNVAGDAPGKEERQLPHSPPRVPPRRRQSVTDSQGNR